MIRYRNIVLIFILMFVFSCKSSKKVADNKANLALSTKQLIKQNKEKSPVFKTLESKLKITYSQKDNSQTHTVSFRLKKDEVIWMSAMFSVVKVLITPEKFSFYNKLDNTFFEGDFSYLSKLLGTETDFNTLQNLLLGESLYGLKDDTYTASVLDGSYVLQPIDQDALMEIFYILDPVLFKIKSQQIHQSEARRHLEVDYKSYQSINEQLLPESMRIVALDSTNEVAIDLEFLNVSLNQDLTFPYKIPSGSEKIKL